MNRFDGVKVFSATMIADRAQLGERATAWLEEQAGRIRLVDMVVSQSSDDRFHMTAISIFFLDVRPAERQRPRDPSPAGASVPRRLNFNGR